MREIEQEKQNLMNHDFRDILKTPIAITCPKVNRLPTKQISHSNEKFNEIDLNVAQAKSKAVDSVQFDRNNISSDISSHSFLLDYIMARTNNICDDIERCRSENSIPNQSKIKALHTLLKKVNTLQRILCEEIKQNNGAIDPNKIIDEMDSVEQAQSKIMEDNLNVDGSKSDKDRERILHKREKMLKEMESCIDKKTRELYLREKEIEKHKNQSKLAKSDKMNEIKNSKSLALVTSNGTETLTDEIPVKIIINLNKNDKTIQPDVVVNDVKWCNRLKKSTQTKENAETVKAETNKTSKLPAKVSTKSVRIERTQFDNLSQSTSVTSYMNPPDCIRTQLTTSLEQCAQLEVDNANNSHVEGNELLHYIVRLLGMSRSSIEHLNMSSVSTVRTPASSIINISSNNQQFISSSTSTPVSVSSFSMDQRQPIDKSKLQQLARFLTENQNFNSNDKVGNENSNEIEKIDCPENNTWNNILSKKNSQSKSKSESSEKPMSHEVKNNHQNSSEEQIAKDDLIAKYDELTQSCTKRIINLDSMIAKVREEKQKLLENTLSSGGSLIITAPKENLTEYMDYAIPHKTHANQQHIAKEDTTSFPLSDSKSTNAPSSDFSSTSATAADITLNEPRINLMTTRNEAFGDSKDSGVGNSRPVTSSDYRESPDLRQNTKANDSELKNTLLLTQALRDSKDQPVFEPILKDIPKISYRIGVENIQPTYLAEPETHILLNSRERNTKYPPAALTRYNPFFFERIFSI